MGNLRCQGDRVRLAIGRTISSRLLDISRLLRLLRRIAGARSRVGHPPLSAEQHQLACLVPGDALSIQGEPVHQLARSWLQYRLTLASSTVLSKSKQPRAKLSSLGCPECVIANFNSQQFLWHSCKNHKNHKLLIFTPLLRLFDMACYATTVLIRRI